MLHILQTALELGFLYALVPMALFLSFRVLDIADMTTDGCFVLGTAVSVTMAAAGHPFLAIPTAMAAELAIYEDLAKAGIPHYTGADSFVRNGAFATCGVNYTDLGSQTADLAYTAMTEGMDGLEDYYVTEGGIITVNTETAATLGIDYSVFNDMGTVVEVQTTEE